MPTRKVLHAADIHLDSPLHRLESYPGAPAEEIRSATRRALTNMIDLAISEQVDLVVIAGDLYDGDWNEFSTGLHFVYEATRLVREKIPLVVIRGNHDAHSVMTNSLPLPQNPDGSEIMLNDKKVDRRVFESIGIAVHGQSFATKAVYENLSLGYPAPIRGLFNIGILHTSLTGADGHDNYAPCKPTELQDKGYDYWALGHIHERRECHQPGNAPIVFSGNIQGRNIRETGAKGCVIVSISDDQKPKSVFHALDVVRWQSFTHDISGDNDRDEVLDAFANWLPNEIANAEGRPLAVRVNLVGSSPLSQELHRHQDSLAHEFRSIAMRHNRAVWFENLKIRATNRRPPTSTRTQDSTAADAAHESIAHVIASIRDDDSALRDLVQPLKKLWSKLPPELTHHPTEPFLLSDETLTKSWLEASEPILMNHLYSEDGQ